MRNVMRWCIAVAVVALVFSAPTWLVMAGPQPTGAPAPAIGVASPLLGDEYIESAVTDYLFALAAVHHGDVARLNDTAVDVPIARTAAFGRFAKHKFTSFAIRSIHDERMVSSNGPGQPATAWTAVATVALTQSGKRHGFNITLRGTYGSGTVDDAQAGASAQ